MNSDPLYAIYDQLVKDTQNLLNQNLEWIQRYDIYSQQIQNNLGNIALARKSFNQWEPLKFYLNVTNAKVASRGVKFDIRYLGQNVAYAIYSKSLKIYITKKLLDTNIRDFDCHISLQGVAWNGPKAKEFRDFFKNRKAPRNVFGKGNEEHRLESLLISEFIKSNNKVLPHVKSVLLANFRFPIPTPLRASNHKQLKYSGASGGGIDILARAGTGKSTNLCIMEVKDENSTKEPPREVMKQSIAYATFIRELLRSKSGASWWKLFGYESTLPKQLVLYAVCAMPSNANNDITFGGTDLNINGDIIRLHYMYFTEANNKITSINTSLP